MRRACALLLGGVLLAAAGCDWKDQASAPGGGPGGAPPPGASTVAAGRAPARLGGLTGNAALRDAVGPASPNQLAGGRLFDGRATDGVFNPGALGSGGVAASFSPSKTVAGFTGYTAPPAPAGLHIGDVPPPDTNATNPIGARIEAFMSYARAAKNMCYQAVASVLEAAGVIAPLPNEYRGRAYEFALAYDQNVAGVKSRFSESDVLSAYPFRRGTVLVWGNLNCSVSGSAAGRASGHIEIVRRLNCADPTHPSRAACPSITDRHFATVDRTYPELSSFARMRHQRTGEPCVRAFEPREPASI